MAFPRQQPCSVPAQEAGGADSAPGEPAEHLCPLLRATTEHKRGGAPGSGAGQREALLQAGRKRRHHSGVTVCQKREQRDETQASGREPGSRSGAVREAWENTLLVLRSFQLRSECPERGWKVAKTTAF